MKYPILRTGTTDICAKTMIGDTSHLEHGKVYTGQELGLKWWLRTGKDEKPPMKFQFIIEGL